MGCDSGRWIRPYPERRLASASGSYNSVHGQISAAWKYHGDQIAFHIETSVNAQILFPDGTNQDVMTGEYEYKVKAVD